jgi:hypothetical protein
MLRAPECRWGPHHRQVSKPAMGLVPRVILPLRCRPGSPDSAPPACNRGAVGAAAADCRGQPLHAAAAGSTSGRFTRPRAARPCFGRGGTRPAGGPRPHLPSPAPGPPPAATRRQPRQRPGPPAPAAMGAAASDVACSDHHVEQPGEESVRHDHEKEREHSWGGLSAGSRNHEPCCRDSTMRWRRGLRACLRPSTDSYCSPWSRRVRGMTSTP